MNGTPDQHDPDWPRYSETILRFDTTPEVSIDLRAVVSAAGLEALHRIGLSEPFAVMTAFDPRGENLPPEENDRLSRKLDGRLSEMGLEFTRVDACSPDGGHCECSVAAKMAQADAVKLGIEFEQVAIFWFDGAQFWIVGAAVSTDPVMLPRSS